MADAVLAVSLGVMTSRGTRELQILAIRTIDSPARLTNSGVADAVNSATMIEPAEGGNSTPEMGIEAGVWNPPIGGMRRDLLSRVLDACVGSNGVGEEVLAGLEAVDVG